MNALEKLIKECEEIGSDCADIPEGFLEGMGMTADQVTTSQRQLLTMWVRRNEMMREIGRSVDQHMEESDRAEAFTKTARLIWIGFETTMVEEIIRVSADFGEDQLAERIIQQCAEIDGGAFVPPTGKFEKGDTKIGEMTTFQKQLWTLADRTRAEMKATLARMEEAQNSNPKDNEEFWRLEKGMPRLSSLVTLYHQNIFWYDVCTHLGVFNMDRIEACDDFSIVLKARAFNPQFTKQSRFMNEWSVVSES